MLERGRGLSKRQVEEAESLPCFADVLLAGNEPPFNLMLEPGVVAKPRGEFGRHFSM